MSESLVDIEPVDSNRSEVMAGVLRAFTNTIAAIAGPDAAQVAELREYERVLLQSGTADPDIVAKYSACLADVRAAVMGRLASATPREIDAVTGMPNPSALHQDLQITVNTGREAAAIILVLDQLRALSARFGATVGDQVLQLVGADLSEQLGSAGTLLRWNGPSFVLLCSKAQAEAVRQKIRAMVAKRIEKTINVETRSIHIKINFSWEVVEVAGDTTADAAVTALDGYLACKMGSARP